MIGLSFFFVSIKHINIFLTAASEDLLSRYLVYANPCGFVVNHFYTLLASFIWSINMINMTSRLWPDKFITF